MSDIYEQKARKYKNKYLKLKLKLKGGRRQVDEDGDKDPYRDNDPYFNKAYFNKDGKFPRTTKASDCTRDIPFREYLSILNIKPEYNLHNNLDDNFNLHIYFDYDRILLIYYDYKKELENYKKIQNIDTKVITIDKTYIREIVFAGKIDNFSLWNFFWKTEKFRILEDIYFRCKILNKDYAYIISRKIYENNNIQDHLKLTYLITAINKFIFPLHKAGFVLNNIVWDNIMIEPRSNKIIFDSSKITESKNTKIDIIALYELGYAFVDKVDKKIINPQNYTDIDNLIPILNNIIQHLQTKI
jgi:hypothetical protein